MPTCYMSEKYGDLNPNARRHRRFLDAIVDVLDPEVYISTPELAEQLEDKLKDENSWEPGYIRSMLTYARPYLVDEGRIEVDEDPRGGNPTYLWRKA